MGSRTRIGFAVVCTGLAAAAGLALVQATKAEPKLEITFSHYGAENDYQYAIIDIRNVGNAPAKYLGDTFESPAFSFVQKDSAGLWQKRVRFCGTGLMNQYLNPGEQIRSTNYINPAREWKIGLTYSKPGLRDRLPQRLRPWFSFLPEVQGRSQTVWSSHQPGTAAELAVNAMESR